VDSHDHEQHETPPRTLREVLGKATVITGLGALGVWLVAAGYSAMVLVTLAVEGDKNSVSFAIFELGAALVVLAALGLFATLTAFLLTHAVRAVRPRPPKDPTPPTDPSRSTELAE
jgi:hypothetical protein